MSKPISQKELLKKFEGLYGARPKGSYNQWTSRENIFLGKAEFCRRRADFAQVWKVAYDAFMNGYQSAIKAGKEGLI